MTAAKLRLLPVASVKPVMPATTPLVLRAPSYTLVASTVSVAAKPAESTTKLPAVMLPKVKPDAPVCLMLTALAPAATLMPPVGVANVSA